MCYNMVESWKRDVKWKKLVTKGQVLILLIWNIHNRQIYRDRKLVGDCLGLRQEGMESDCWWHFFFLISKFLIVVIKKSHNLKFITVTIKKCSLVMLNIFPLLWNTSPELFHLAKLEHCPFNNFPFPPSLHSPCYSTFCLYEL